MLLQNLLFTLAKDDTGMYVCNCISHSIHCNKWFNSCIIENKMESFSYKGECVMDVAKCIKRLGLSCTQMFVGLNFHEKLQNKIFCVYISRIRKVSKKINTL